jgi:hypothetical protein
MRKTLFCSFLLLSVFIISHSFALAQKSGSSTPKSAPSGVIMPESIKDLAVPKPVIKNVLVDDTGASLTWRVVIENTGNTPTTGTDNLEFYRNPGSGNPPELSAGSVSVPVIQAGETKDVSATLNPDPQNGNYTIKLVNSKGKVLQSRPYGLGIPAMVIEDVKIAEEFKVAVYLRRIKSEPYVEIVTKTATIQGANQPIRK